MAPGRDVDVQRDAGREYARLCWQCRRGMAELDALLQPFMERRYAGLSARQRQVFEELLTCPDQLLLEYLMGRTVPIDTEVVDVIQQIRATARS